MIRAAIRNALRSARETADEYRRIVLAPLKSAWRSLSESTQKMVYAGLICSLATLFVIISAVVLLGLGAITYTGFYLYMIPIQAHHVPVIFDYSAKLAEADEARFASAWETLSQPTNPLFQSMPQPNQAIGFMSSTPPTAWSHTVAEISGPLAWATLDAGSILGPGNTGSGASDAPQSTSRSRQRIPSYGFPVHTTTSGGASMFLASRASSPRDVASAGAPIAARHSHLFRHHTPSMVTNLASGSQSVGVYSSNRYLPAPLKWLEGWLPWWLDVFASGSTQAEAAPYWTYSEASTMFSTASADFDHDGSSMDEKQRPMLDSQIPRLTPDSNEGDSTAAQAPSAEELAALLDQLTPKVPAPNSLLREGTTYDIFLELQLPEDPPLAAPSSTSRLPWKGTVLTARVELFSYDHRAAAHDIGLQRLRAYNQRLHPTSTVYSGLFAEKSHVPTQQAHHSAQAPHISKPPGQVYSSPLQPRWLSQLLPLTQHPFKVHPHWRPIASSQRSFGPFASSNVASAGVYNVPVFGQLIRLTSRIFPFSLFFAPDPQPAVTWPGSAEVNAGTIPGSTGIVAGTAQWFFSMVRSAVLFWPRVLGFVQPTQTHTLMIMQDYVERVDLPTNGVRITLLGPEAFETPVLSARLNFVSRLSGLRYYMYHYFWTFAILGTLFFSCVHTAMLIGLGTCFLCTFFVARHSSVMYEDTPSPTSAALSNSVPVHSELASAGRDTFSEEQMSDVLHLGAPGTTTHIAQQRTYPLAHAPTADAAKVGHVSGRRRRGRKSPLLQDETLHPPTQAYQHASECQELDIGPGTKTNTTCDPAPSSSTRCEHAAATVGEGHADQTAQMAATLTNPSNAPTSQDAQLNEPAWQTATSTTETEESGQVEGAFQENVSRVTQSLFGFGPSSDSDASSEREETSLRPVVLDLETETGATDEPVLRHRSRSPAMVMSASAQLSTNPPEVESMSSITAENALVRSDVVDETSDS